MGAGRNLSKIGKMDGAEAGGSASGKKLFTCLPAQEGLLHLVSGGGSYQASLGQRSARGDACRSKGGEEASGRGCVVVRAAGEEASEETGSR